MESHAMPLTTDEKLLSLSHEIIEAFDKVDGGIHPGFRPAHAKGMLLTGGVTPSPEGAPLARAAPLPSGPAPRHGAFPNFRGISASAGKGPPAARRRAPAA